MVANFAHNGIKTWKKMGKVVFRADLGGGVGVYSGVYVGGDYREGEEEGEAETRGGGGWVGRYGGEDAGFCYLR